MSDFWKRRKVFVTGATGLLGSHLVQSLLDREARVHCLVRDWVPGAELVRSGNLGRSVCIRGELEDLELLTRSLNEHEIETVFHLGAQTIVGTASRSPLSTFESNVRGTWNLLEACHRTGGLVKRIVVASSDKAYGAHDRLPYTEDAPLQGRFPYDVSKSCADLIALSYHASFGLPLAITRCGNLFGGGDLNTNRLIPGTIIQALQGEPVEIRSDGTFVRDYFYVKDAVDAYLLLAERLLEPDVVGQAFNFGHDRPLSVLQMVDLILAAMGRQDLVPIILDQASNEIPRQYLDCSKARRVLGWSPRRSLETAIEETIAWYREGRLGT